MCSIPVVKGLTYQNDARDLNLSESSFRGHPRSREVKNDEKPILQRLSFWMFRNSHETRKIMKIFVILGIHNYTEFQEA